MARLIAFMVMTTLPDACMVAANGEDAPGDATTSVEPEVNSSQSEQKITDTVNQWLTKGYQDRGIESAARCEDAVFLRRVYLDLVGRVPTEAEYQDWIQTDLDRDRLIDSLLNSEGYVQHFTDLFDSLLMGRASEDTYHQRQQQQWRQYLEQAIRENRPWNRVIEEILLARPDRDETRGAVWFLYERNNDYQKMAESIAPAVFGFRIECAQCHDHMMADEIKQAHYWGLVAFFNRSKNEKADGVLKVSESAIGGFSEFADLTGSSTPNHLVFLDAKAVDEQRPEKPDEQEDSEDLYQASDSAPIGRVPKFSRRERFVQDVVREHPRVARAFANRVWALVMGRGLVHPFDEMDSMHAPSHPELLAFLAQDAQEHQLDLRRLVRGLVRSDAYHKKSTRPVGVEDPASFAWYLERPLTGEQLARSTLIALQGESNPSALGIFRQQFPEVLPRDFVSTVKNALFLTNGADFDRLIQSSTSSDHLVPRLLDQTDREKQIDLLFTTLFSRKPDPEERQAVHGYLDSRSDEPMQAMQQVVWSLLTSAEFRFNH